MFPTSSLRSVDEELKTEEGDTELNETHIHEVPREQEVYEKVRIQRTSRVLQQYKLLRALENAQFNIRESRKVKIQKKGYQKPIVGQFGSDVVVVQDTNYNLKFFDKDLVELP